MPTTVRVEGVYASLDRMGSGMLDRCSSLFVRTARGRASRRTNELADSIEAGPVYKAGSTFRTTVEVGAEHGVYQDRGTGIYGPEGRPITPRRADGVLVFDWPAAGGVVFARSVRGTPPTRFWQRTVADWPQIVRRVEAGGG